MEACRVLPPCCGRVARKRKTTKAILIANQTKMTEMAICATARPRDEVELKRERAGSVPWPTGFERIYFMLLDSSLRSGRDLTLAWWLLRSDQQHDPFVLCQNRRSRAAVIMTSLAEQVRTLR